MINILLKLKYFLLSHLPATLYKWALLEDKKKLILKAVEDNAPIHSVISDYLSTAFDFHVDTDKLYWKDAVLYFVDINSHFIPTIKLPLIEPDENKPKSEKEQPWEYDNRSWYFYSNLLAKNYGWDYNKIKKLKINDALALIQEILVGNQLDNEFLWSMSEIAYPYNKQTKKSEFKPLNRPSWMIKKFKKSTQKSRVPVRLMPVGNTVDLVNNIEQTQSTTNAPTVPTSETSD